MAVWIESVMAGLATSKGRDEAFACIADGARQLGFDHCAYGLRLPFPFNQPKVFMCSNYDPRWRARYEEARYVESDPTVLHGLRRAQPLTWSDRLFMRTPQLWEEARSFDLRVGWAQSCFDRNGSVGMLSLARASIALTPRELAAQEPLLRWLVSVAHAALSGLIAGPESRHLQPLTAREVEILRWTADGKTSEEAADILGISGNTVNFHMKNVIRKLNAANRTAAVARAVALGLIN